MVQVNSSNSLSAQQLQALENTALGQYQSQTGTDFSKLMKQVDDVAQEGDQAPDATTQIGTATTISAKEGNSQLTGTFSVDALVAVGTIGANGKVGQSLRAGQGATTMVADPAGRLLVTDTRGGQLLAFGVDPLILRQAYPVAQSPYGLVGSRGLAWVSQTSANIVIGYDLSTGIPLEKVRYPTVRQPNTLAFDDVAGTLYVVSGVGGGVQTIEHAATGPR